MVTTSGGRLGPCQILIKSRFYENIYGQNVVNYSFEKSTIIDVGKGPAYISDLY